MDLATIITYKGMIKKVYTLNKIIYTSESDISEYNEEKYTVIPNCKFKQTDYGSVIIERPTFSGLLELYPSAISHIIH